MTPKCPDCKRDQDDCICEDELESLRKQNLEQAAQIEMMRDALNTILALPTNKDIWKYRIEHHPVIGEVTDYYSAIVNEALSILPIQAFEQFAANVRNETIAKLEQLAKKWESLSEKLYSDNDFTQYGVDEFTKRHGEAETLNDCAAAIREMAKELT